MLPQGLLSLNSLSQSSPAPQKTRLSLCVATKSAIHHSTALMRNAQLAPRDIKTVKAEPIKYYILQPNSTSSLS